MGGATLFLRARISFSSRPFHHRVHVVVRRLAVDPFHAGDAEAGGFDGELQGAGREVVHVVGPAEAAPAVAAQLAAERIVVGNLDDGLAISAHLLPTGFEKRQRIDLVLKEVRYDDEIDAVVWEQANAAQGILLQARTAERLQRFVGLAGEFLGNLHALRNAAANHVGGEAGERVEERVSFAAAQIDEADGPFRERPDAVGGQFIHLVIRAADFGAKALPPNAERIEHWFDGRAAFGFFAPGHFPGKFLFEGRVLGRVFEVDKARLEALAEDPRFWGIGQGASRSGLVQQRANSVNPFTGMNCGAGRSLGCNGHFPPLEEEIVTRLFFVSAVEGRRNHITAPLCAGRSIVSR